MTIGADDRGKDERGRMRQRVDDGLEHYLARDPGVPDTLARAMRYSLFPGGKRVRPLLALAACRTAGGDDDLALPAACALEAIHSYSLIHDDLPAMDDDDMRRGRPTSHKMFGEAVAILAGDALVSLAFQILARDPPGDQHGPMRLRILAVIADAASATGIIAGQVLDLETEGKPYDEPALERIHRCKTGVLITAAVVSGALAAGKRDDELQPFREFGAAIGLAFQVVDDLLDVEASSDTLGKTAGKDARAAKATFPALLGMEESRRRADALIDRALTAMAPFGSDAEMLIDLARRVRARSH